jgi:large subunit ribosomal protein L48
MADSLEINIIDNWAHPPKKSKIIRYKENSTNIETEYNLTNYERYVQIADIQAPIYSVFMRFLQSAQPEGIKMSVVHHTNLIEESRYVPDKELLELKDQLDKAGGASKKRR